MVVIIGEPDMGKSTFSNFIAGYPDGDPQSFGAGDSGSATKSPEVRRVQWRGDGRYFTIVDTPGASDPGGSDADKEQFREILNVLRYDVSYISAIIHVVKGTTVDGTVSTAGNSPPMEKNLRLYRSMFGAALSENLITEVVSWRHYEMSGEDRDEFRGVMADAMQAIFPNPNMTINVVFVDPIDALPEEERKRVERRYGYNWDAEEEQKNQLKKLEELIWGRQSFSCSRSCKFVEQVFDQGNNYPTITTSDEYSSSRYKVSA